MDKPHPAEGHPGGWYKTCHSCALAYIENDKRQLNAIDEALDWVGSGKGRIETIHRLRNEHSELQRFVAKLYGVSRKDNEPVGDWLIRCINAEQEMWESSHGG